MTAPLDLAPLAQPWRGSGWRVVEAQHRVSTLKLVDTLAEQALLETLLESTKPTLPAECGDLDYLLATPFRYGTIYPYGSRFRRAGRTLGVFYAAERVDTALAEMAFYRLLFFAESPTTPYPADAADYTAFSSAIAVKTSIDLTTAPLASAGDWTSLTDYAACQALADAARTAGIALIRYRSVRDPGGRANLALLTCAGFARPAPITRQTWRIRVGPAGVQALCDWPRRSLEFPLSLFTADPRLNPLVRQHT